MSHRFGWKSLLPALAALAGFAAGAPPSRAQTNLFTITGLTQSPAVAGQTTYFFATLTNEDPNNAVMLGQVSPDFAESYFTQDFNDDYDANANGLITLAAYDPSHPAASQYSGEILAVDIDPATPTATYPESLQLYDAAGDFPPLATQDFSLTVAPAPEPSGLLPLGLGAVAALVLQARRRDVKQSQ